MTGVMPNPRQRDDQAGLQFPISHRLSAHDDSDDQDDEHQ